jgi:hypothetical protein
MSKSKKSIVLPDIEDIQHFNSAGQCKSDNDSNNKFRENIIANMNNIDNKYFNDAIYGNDWRQIKNLFDTKMREICPSYSSYKIEQKAGRKFNYDFEVSFFNMDKILIKIGKLEFKFNASTIDETPQFVSPMKPSQYLSQSFEEYYYLNYLIPLLKKFNLTIPDPEIYLKQIHGNKPKCMVEAQNLYYQGCKQSSQFTGAENAIAFYKACNDASVEAIRNFINESDLDVEKLNQYLIQSQDEKIYLLYKNGNFYLQNAILDDYIIESYVKGSNKYIATSKSNKKIEILLRWKNGNGIAFPAFQIS